MHILVHAALVLISIIDAPLCFHTNVRYLKHKVCQLLLNYKSSQLYMETLSPQALARQSQSSSSEPHPLSILSQPASRTFHDTLRTLLGPSRSRKTPSLELTLSLLFLLLSGDHSELHLHLSSLPPSVYPRLGFFHPAILTPAGQRPEKKAFNPHLLQPVRAGRK